MKSPLIDRTTRFLVSSSLVASGLLLASCSDNSSSGSGGPGSSVPLFDGVSLAGWTEVRNDGTTGGEPVWSVIDGVLTSNAAADGYIYSEQTFQDFELVIDWRWSAEDEVGDGGLLLRMVGEPLKVMPKCIKAPIAPGAVGDIHAYRGTALEGDADRFGQMSGEDGIGDYIIVEKTDDFEDEVGQWNRYEVIVRGGTMEVKVNDELVNSASGLEPVAGRVGLQSVGGSIQIDYIEITPL